MITIGMGVHVRNSYLHVIDDDGSILKHGRCHNTMMDLAKFLGPVVLESTTDSRAIQRLLIEP